MINLESQKNHQLFFPRFHMQKNRLSPSCLVLQAEIRVTPFQKNDLNNCGDVILIIILFDLNQANNKYRKYKLLIFVKKGIFHKVKIIKIYK
jgi:hypothetical protein